MYPGTLGRLPSDELEEQGDLGMEKRGKGRLEMPSDAASTRPQRDRARRG